MRVRFRNLPLFGLVHVLVDVRFHGHQLTRLETRTKESTHVCKYMRCIRECAVKEVVLIFSWKQPTSIFGERFECQHICWDPKDGELYLRRVNPGETLVEARSDTDVQIVRQTWI